MLFKFIVDVIILLQFICWICITVEFNLKLFHWNDFGKLYSLDCKYVPLLTVPWLGSTESTTENRTYIC